MCTTFFDLNDFLFGFAAVLFCSCTVYFKKPSYFSKSLEHIHGHGGFFDLDVENLHFVVFTATQKLQFSLKNVSSRPSHLSNWGKLYIRYISLTITHAYMLCVWLMSSDFDDSEGCSNVYFI